MEKAGKIFSDLSILLGEPRSHTGIVPPDGQIEGCDVHYFLQKGGCMRLPRLGEESRICICILIPEEMNRVYEYCLFTRRQGDFSEFEVGLCDEIAKGATILWEPFTDPGFAFPAHARAAIYQTAILVGISRFLRFDPFYFWGLAQLIMAIQNLTFIAYEGKPCTSAFACLQRDIKSAIKESWAGSWRFELLDRPVPVDHSFFREVGSYRYVDGNNTLYLARVQKGVAFVVGTAALLNQKEFSLSEKVSHHHLRNLLYPGESVVVTANRNAEVEVVPFKNDSKDFLCLTRGHWRLVNLGLIESLLGRNINDPVIVSIVVEAARALSFLRYGTLILFPNDEMNLPAFAGMIDKSPLGEDLRKHIKGKFIGDLVGGGQFLNILSSDGMTIISRDGKIIDTGVIVSNQEMSPTQGGGGARTAAAKAASRYGVALKVSADGPVSVFLQEQLIYSTL